MFNRPRRPSRLRLPKRLQNRLQTRRRARTATNSPVHRMRSGPLTPRRRRRRRPDFPKAGKDRKTDGQMDRWTGRFPDTALLPDTSDASYSSRTRAGRTPDTLSSPVSLSGPWSPQSLSQNAKDLPISRTNAPRPVLSQKKPSAQSDRQDTKRSAWCAFHLSARQTQESQKRFLP